MLPATVGERVTRARRAADLRLTTSPLLALALLLALLLLLLCLLVYRCGRALPAPLYLGRLLGCRVQAAMVMVMVTTGGAASVMISLLTAAL